jgi:hypothetical protein
MLRFFVFFSCSPGSTIVPTSNYVCPFLNAQILPLIPELVNIFAQVAASPIETSEVKALVGRAFCHLISLYGQQMQPLLNNLSPAHANALSAFSTMS